MLNTLTSFIPSVRWFPARLAFSALEDQNWYPLRIHIGIAIERHATIKGTVNDNPRRTDDLLQIQCVQQKYQPKDTAKSISYLLENYVFILHVYRISCPLSPLHGPLEII